MEGEAKGQTGEREQDRTSTSAFRVLTKENKCDVTKIDMRPKVTSSDKR